MGEWPMKEGVKKKIYRKTSNNVPPLIIPAPLKFQKKVSRTSNSVRPLIIPAPTFLLVCRLAVLIKTGETLHNFIQ